MDMLDMDSSCQKLYEACITGNIPELDNLLKSIGKNVHTDQLLLTAAENNYAELMTFILPYALDINRINKWGQTSLHIASEKGFKDIVEILLLNKAHVNCKDQKSKTPLHLAVEKNNKEIVSLLLANNANSNTVTSCGKAPIHEAVEKSDTSMLELLLASENINIDITDLKVGYNTALHFAAQKGNTSAVQMLLKANPSINLKNNQGEIPLHLAVRSNNIIIVDLLLISGSNANVLTKCGYSPLHLACKYGTDEIVELLIRYNANVNIKGPHKKTPLFLAVKNNRENITKLLIKHGAIFEDKTGMTPLQLAAQKGCIKILHVLLEQPDIRHLINSSWTSCKKTALHFAVENRRINIVKLLISHGAKVNLEEVMGNTSLHLASSNGYFEIVQFLLSKHAAINCVNKQGKTPLFLAIECGNEKTVNLLLTGGANIFCTDDFGDSALSRAASMGLLEIAQLLLQLKPDVDNMNANKETPLSLALKRPNCKDMIALLLQNGANLEIANKESNSTPLLTASLESCDPEYLKLLLEQKPNIKAKNKLGQNALHIAVGFNKYCYRNLDFILTLLRGGCDVNARDLTGSTPLHYCRDIEIMNLLLIYGADVTAQNRKGENALNPIFNMSYNLCMKEIKRMKKRKLNQIYSLYNYLIVDSEFVLMSLLDNKILNRVYFEEKLGNPVIRFLLESQYNKGLQLKKLLSKSNRKIMQKIIDRNICDDSYY